MEEDTHFPSDSDLDFSFNSCASSTSTFTTSSSTRTSLSFNDPSRPSISRPLLPHRKDDPKWSAIIAATNLSTDGQLQLSHLKLLRHLGTGNLGCVFLCRLRDSEDATFALKVVDRDALTHKKLTQVEMESAVLASLDHPFLPTLYAHIEVSHYTCLLMDYAARGDLHSVLRKQPESRFSVETVKFFAAEVLIALEYLHAMGIVYRDLKPENVLIREDGHVMLSDFDLSFTADVIPTVQTSAHRPRPRKKGGCFWWGRKRQEEELATEFVAEPTDAYSRSCVGTHEYLAPELVTGKGHGNGVDWWAFGVFVYELLYGRTPFKGPSKEATLRNIASKGLSFPESDDLGVRTDEARDLIGRLLVKDPRRRLGCAKGATEIKRHPFFDGIRWPLIREYKPPEVCGAREDGNFGGASGRRRGWKGLGKKRRRSGLDVNNKDRKWA